MKFLKTIIPQKKIRILSGSIVVISMLLSGCFGGQSTEVLSGEDRSGSAQNGTESLAPPEMQSSPEAYVTYPDNRPGERPDFYLGVDLSYVNEMDDCGAVYLEDGKPRDAFELFKEHGAQLVRARLWHDAEWTEYSDPADIERTFSRALEQGMFTLLDFHYSDNWADPSKQAIPAAWKDLSDEELIAAVYSYTYDTLIDLHKKGLMPDFVQVGNETNSGLLKQVMELDWQRDSKLFNAGIQAVRAAGKETGTDPKIILHVAQPDNAGWWFQNAAGYGVTDFDIIGLSYYPQWSQFSISDVGAHVSYLRQAFQKEVMIVETAYLWTTDAVDETASNVLNQGIRGYPFSPEGQLQFMTDLTQSLISNGGLGVVYWEPAWVSTECSTRWGQGSHWENATFFDFNNNNEVHQGIDFLSYPYLFPTSLVDGILEEQYGEGLVQDNVGDNLEGIPHLDLISLHGREDPDFVYLLLTVSGDIYKNPWGSYLIYLDITQDGQGADIDPGKRPITVADPFKPEFRLDITALERKGTVSGSYQLYAWDGTAWEKVTFTSGAAILTGSPSTIEVQFPKSLFESAEFINVEAVSSGRGRVHTAGDLLGSSISASDWNEPVIIKDFFRLDFLN